MSFLADLFSGMGSNNKNSNQINGLVYNPETMGYDTPKYSGNTSTDNTQLGLAGIQTILGGIGQYKNYGLQKKALNSNLADASLQRSLTADNYINQQGVIDSLASAVGESQGLSAIAEKAYGKYRQPEVQ